MMMTREEAARSPQREMRSRGFVNAPLTTVLRFIHSSAASAHRPPPPSLSPFRHVGPKEVAFYTHADYTHTHTHRGCSLHGHAANRACVHKVDTICKRGSKPTRHFSRFLFLSASLSFFLSFAGRRIVYRVCRDYRFI